MFKPVDIETTNLRIQKAWRGLQRIVQTVIEHMRVFNNSGAPLVRGDIVALDASGARQVTLADGNGMGTVTDALCVVCEPIPTGGSGIARYQGLTYVHFETGLGPLAEGVECYLSDTAGRATTATNEGIYLGVISNASTYSDQNPFAWVIINRCCPAAEVAQN